ncbi:MAG: laminin B domain-containing protein [Verrucomicrobiota bacterium]
MFAWRRLAIGVFLLCLTNWAVAQSKSESRGTVVSSVDFAKDGASGWRIVDDFDSVRRSTTLGGSLNLIGASKVSGWTDWYWVGPESGAQFSGDLQKVYGGEIAFTLRQGLASAYRHSRPWGDPRLDRFSQALNTARNRITWSEEKVTLSIEGRNGKSLAVTLEDARTEEQRNYILRIDVDDKPSLRTYRVRLDESAAWKTKTSEKEILGILSDVKKISIRSSHCSGSRSRIELTEVSLIAPPEPVIIIDRSTHGYSNDSLGTVLKGTSEAFPEDKDPRLKFDSAPSLAAAQAVLGQWLQSPPALSRQHWEMGEVPRYWKTGTDTAVVYEINVPKSGYDDVKLSLGADNGLFAWLNGEYLGGYISPGGTRLGEWDLDLARLEPGRHFLQFLRVDHGSINGFAILMTGVGDPLNEDAVVDELDVEPAENELAVTGVSDELDAVTEEPRLGILLVREEDRYVPRSGSTTTLLARICRNDNGVWRPTSAEADRRKIKFSFVGGSKSEVDSSFAFTLNPSDEYAVYANEAQRKRETGGTPSNFRYEIKWLNEGIGRESDDWIRTAFPVSEYRARLRCFSGGGFVEVLAQADDCISLVRDGDRIVAASSDQAIVKVPKDDNGNGIADGYYHKRSDGRLSRDEFFGPKADYDEEGLRKFDEAGDHMSAYDEYRLNMKYEFLDLRSFDQKDLIVQAPKTFNKSYFAEFEKLTGIKVQLCDHSLYGWDGLFMGAVITYSDYKGMGIFGPDEKRKELIRVHFQYHHAAKLNPQKMKDFKEDLTTALLEVCGLDPFDVKPREAKLLIHKND